MARTVAVVAAALCQHNAVVAAHPPHPLPVWISPWFPHRPVRRPWVRAWQTGPAAHRGCLHPHQRHKTQQGRWQGRSRGQCGFVGMTWMGKVEGCRGCVRTQSFTGLWEHTAHAGAMQWCGTRCRLYSRACHGTPCCSRCCQYHRLNSPQSRGLAAICHWLLAPRSLLPPVRPQVVLVEGCSVMCSSCVRGGGLNTKNTCVIKMTWKGWTVDGGLEGSRGKQRKEARV